MLNHKFTDHEHSVKNLKKPSCPASHSNALTSAMTCTMHKNGKAGDKLTPDNTTPIQ
jgi:hypothetical protein